MGGGEILVKRLVMGVTVKWVEGRNVLSLACSGARPWLSAASAETKENGRSFKEEIKFSRTFQVWSFQGDKDYGKPAYHKRLI